MKTIWRTKNELSVLVRRCVDSIIRSPCALMVADDRAVGIEFQIQG